MSTAEQNKSERMEKLKQKFAGSATIGMPTPENQFTKMKKSKEEQVKAVQVAKARAARYNMTLRALAIKTTQAVTKMQDDDRKAAIENKKKAAKYNMTSRALPLALVKKDQENLGKALAMEVSPSIAKEVIDVVAKKNKRLSVQRQDSEEAHNKEEFEPKKIPKSKMVMDDLGDALSSGDDDAIDRAILTSFLKASAPQLLPQIDKLLVKYKNQRQVLFDKLVTEIPDGQDPIISGQQKADKEVSEVSAPKIDASKGKEIDIADDDSMIVDANNIDEFDPNEKNAAPKLLSKQPVPNNVPSKMEEVIREDDEDSLIVDVDKAYQDSYEKTIKAAENSKDAKMKSIERSKSIEKNDRELESALNEYKEEERKGSIASQDSLVFTTEEQAPLVDNSQYIVEADLEETNAGKGNESATRWAVQLQSKNQALRNKLKKQGLKKEQIDELLADLDHNTSEML